MKCSFIVVLIAQAVRIWDINGETISCKGPVAYYNSKTEHDWFTIEEIMFLGHSEVDAYRKIVLHKLASSSV